MRYNNIEMKKPTAKRISCLLLCLCLVCLWGCRPHFPESPLTVYDTDSCIKSHTNHEVGMYEEYQNNDAPRVRTFSYGEYSGELFYVDSARRSYVSYDMDRYEGVLNGAHLWVEYRQNTDEVCVVNITPQAGESSPFSDLPETKEAYLGYIQDILTAYGVSTDAYNQRTVTTLLKKISGYDYTEQNGFLVSSDVDEAHTIAEYRFWYRQTQNGIVSCDALGFVFSVKEGSLWFCFDTEPMLTSAELSLPELEAFTDENIKNAIAHWTMAQHPEEKTWIWDVEIKGKTLFWYGDGPALLVSAVRYEKSGIGKGLEGFVLPIKVRN